MVYRNMEAVLFHQASRDERKHYGESHDKGKPRMYTDRRCENL